jgi:hypothetical protein
VRGWPGRLRSTIVAVSARQKSAAVTPM